MKTYSLKDMRKAGCATGRAIRLWETQGLLIDIPRNKNRMRVYLEEHIKAAKIIAVCQAVGLSLSDTKQVLNNYSYVHYQRLQELLRVKRSDLDKMFSHLPAPDGFFDL